MAMVCPHLHGHGVLVPKTVHQHEVLVAGRALGAELVQLTPVADLMHLQVRRICKGMRLRSTMCVVAAADYERQARATEW